MRKKRIAEAALAAAEAHNHIDDCGYRHTHGMAADFPIGAVGFIGGKIPPITDDFSSKLMEEMKSFLAQLHSVPDVKRILVSGNATIVFWVDDTKTVVRCAKGETPDLYAAFTAALGIKLYGSNSQLKKIIDRNTVIQKPKKVKKPADPEPESGASDVFQEA